MKGSVGLNRCHTHPHTRMHTVLSLFHKTTLTHSCSISSVMHIKHAQCHAFPLLTDRQTDRQTETDIDIDRDRNAPTHK